MLKINKIELIGSFQRALLFNISLSMRFISCEITENDVLKVWIYFNKKPTELELDLIYSVVGEVCGDFPGLDDSDVKYFVNNDKEYDALEHLESLIFARYEGAVNY